MAFASPSEHSNVEILLMLLFSCLDLELSLLFGVLKLNVSVSIVCPEKLVIASWLPAKVCEGDGARLIPLSLDLSGLHLIV